MNALTECKAFPAMTQEAVDKVRAFGEHLLDVPQTPITTHHVLHAGLYARTITIPKGVVLTSVLIKRPTLVIAVGDASVWLGDREIQITGHTVIPASGHRRQAYLAHTDLDLTMIFPTDAKSIHAAEEEFTDEVEMLFSRSGANTVVITGE